MQTITIDVSALRNVRDAITQAIDTSIAKHAKVMFEFNGVVVMVEPSTKFNDALRVYLKDSNDLAMAKQKGSKVTSQDALSPDYKYPVKASAPIVEDPSFSVAQNKLDVYVKDVKKFMFTSRKALEFLEEYVKLASVTGVRNIHADQVYNAYHDEGFYEDMIPGGKSSWTDAVKSSAFIIGKAMSHLAKGEVPNPVIVSFIEHWRDLFANNSAQKR